MTSPDDERFAKLRGLFQGHSVAWDKQVTGTLEQSLRSTVALGASPHPGMVHPSLTRQSSIIRHIMSEGPGMVYIPKYSRRDRFAPVPTEITGTHIVLHVREAIGLAPYVGDPFVYSWRVAVDDYGRYVAEEDSTIRYLERTWW